MTFEAVKRDDWMIAGAGLLLIIDLLLLPWFDVSFGPLSVTSTATGSPDGWLGVLAVLAALALVADLGIERLAPTVRVPALRSSRTLTRLALAGACAACVALKFLLHVHFSLFGFGFWGAILLTAALVAGCVAAHTGRGPAVLVHQRGLS